MKARLAVYPGTFDPITNGHLDLIARAAKLFDEVIVAIAVNGQKTPLLSEADRLRLIARAIQEELPAVKNVRTESFGGLLADFTIARNAVAVVRGIRSQADFDFEFQMSLTNAKLAPAVETVFLMPSEPYTYLTSTIVRELAVNGKVVDAFVPACVAETLRNITIRKKH